MPISRRDFFVTTGVLMYIGCAPRGGVSPSEFLVWGGQGLRDGAFIRPRAIGAYNDEVYVIDTTGRLQVFAENGDFRRMWSTPSSENGTPTAVGFSNDGRILVPDTHYSQILEYDPCGELLDQWGAYGAGKNEFIYPTGIVQDSDGAYYISEYGLEAERVHVFDAQRNFLRQWGEHGERKGQFNRAMAIGLHNETVYVADTANHRIQAFTTEGQFLRVIGTPGLEAGKLKFPHDIAVAPDGTLLIAEYGAHRITRFNAQAEYVASLGAAGRKPGQFNGPRGVAVSSSGFVFVADTDNHRIQRFPLGALA